MTLQPRVLHSVHAEHSIGTAGSCMLLVQVRLAADSAMLEAWNCH